MAIGPGEDPVHVREAIDSLSAIAKSDDSAIFVRNGYPHALDLDQLSCPSTIVDATEKRSPAYARNIALSHCPTDVVVFLDSDDVSLPNRRDVLQEAFDDPDLGVAFTSLRVVDSQGQPMGTRSAQQRSLSERDFVGRCPVFLPSAAIRRSNMLVSEFDETLRYAEDYYLWARNFFEGGVKFKAIPSPTVQYRIVDAKVASKNSLKRLKCDLHVRRYVGRHLSRTSLQLVAHMMTMGVVMSRLMPDCLSRHAFRTLMVR